MVPKSVFPASKTVALAGKPAAQYKMNTVFLGSYQSRWKTMKTIYFVEIHQNPENPENGRGDFTLCRDLPGQCHRFKRRKRVFWDHTKVLHRGNFTKFHIEERNLSFFIWKSSKIKDFDQILTKNYWNWSKLVIFWIFENFQKKKIKIRSCRWKLSQISSVQNFFMVPKNAFPAFKTVALAEKVAARCNGNTMFLRNCGKSSNDGFRWNPSKIL